MDHSPYYRDRRFIDKIVYYNLDTYVLEFTPNKLVQNRYQVQRRMNKQNIAILELGVPKLITLFFAGNVKNFEMVYGDMTAYIKSLDTKF